MSPAESWAKDANLALSRKTGKFTVKELCTQLDKLCTNMLTIKGNDLAHGFFSVVHQALKIFQDFSIQASEPELKLAALLLRDAERCHAANKARAGKDPSAQRMHNGCPG